jgi:hypothetical protein
MKLPKISYDPISKLIDLLVDVTVTKLVGFERKEGSL